MSGFEGIQRIFFIRHAQSEYRDHIERISEKGKVDLKPTIDFIRPKIDLGHILGVCTSTARKAIDTGLYVGDSFADITELGVMNLTTCPALQFPEDAKQLYTELEQTLGKSSRNQWLIVGHEEVVDMFPANFMSERFGTRGVPIDFGSRGYGKGVYINLRSGTWERIP